MQKIIALLALKPILYGLIGMLISGLSFPIVGVVVVQKATANLYGTVTSKHNFAVSGNGTSGFGGVTINVNQLFFLYQILLSFSI